MFKTLKKIALNHLNARPPEWYDMIVTMNIKIKKGQTGGSVHVPCAFETLTHSIDFNPSLIKKKSREFVAFFDPKKKYKFIEDKKVPTYKVDEKAMKVIYNPNKFMIELSKSEKKSGYYLDEIERCSHCGQKTVMAEIEETQYKSCPIISVKLSDKATEDLVVPVKFGVARAQFYSRFIQYLIVVGALFYVMHGISMALHPILWTMFLAMSWILFFYSLRTGMLVKWYILHRPTAEITPKQPFLASLAQQLGVL